MDHGSCESNWGKYVRNRLIVVDLNKISGSVHLNLCFYTLPHTNFTWTKNNPKMSDNWQYSLSHTFYMRTNRQHNATLLKNILALYSVTLSEFALFLNPCRLQASAFQSSLVCSPFQQSAGGGWSNHMCYFSCTLQSDRSLDHIIAEVWLSLSSSMTLWSTWWRRTTSALACRGSVAPKWWVESWFYVQFGQKRMV